MGLLRRLLDRLPHDALLIGGEVYMRRWYLAGYAPPVDDPHDAPGLTRPGWWWDQTLPFALRIHEIVANDDSRAFHDHPWPWVSILLRGAYVEVTPCTETIELATSGLIGWCPRPGNPDLTQRRRFRAPALNRHAALDLHVLEVEGRPVWTLFATLRKQRHWGFAGPFGEMPWREFDARFPERDSTTVSGG